MDDDTVKINPFSFFIPKQKEADNEKEDASGASIFDEKNSVQESENDEEIKEALSEASQNEECDDVSQQLYDSMAGIGCNRESFNEVLNNENLTGDDWVNIIQSYNQDYDVDFISMVNNEFTGPKENEDIMEVISSKLLEALDNGNEEALDIIIKGLDSVLHSLESSEFVTNILKGSSIDSFKLISDKYKEITGSDLKQGVINNRKISKEDKDLISSKFNPNDTTIKENVQRGTYLTQAISDAKTKEDVYKILLDYCNNDETIAQTFLDYLGMSDKENNIYQGARQSELMGKIFTNVGNNFVLNQNLLDRFTQYETYDVDKEGQELKRPSKEFYTNFKGELCSINYSYDELNEGGFETITMTFDEGDESKELTFYTTINEKGEIFYHIHNNPPKEDIEENQTEFEHRLVVLKNYTDSTSNQVLSKEDVQERYILLKQHDESVGMTLLTLMNQFQKEGAVDDLKNYLVDMVGSFDILRNVFSTVFGELSDKDIMNEIGAAIIHDQIVQNYLNGNIDEAKELIHGELDRRIQNAHTYQEIYDELFAYYQDSDMALEILLKNVPSYMEVTIDKEKNTITTYDPVSESNIRGNVSLSLDKLNGFEELDMKDVEEAYKFLTYGGTYSSDNVKNYETASRNFGDYNISIETGNELKKRKTPQEALKLITGKEDGYTSKDIEKFNEYYSSDDIRCFDEWVKDEDGNFLYSQQHYYNLKVQYSEEKQDFDIVYQEYEPDGNGGFTLKGEPKNEIPDFDTTNDGTNLFQQLNDDDCISKLQKTLFDGVYNRNEKEINTYIDEYAAWACKDEESIKYYSKILGKNFSENDLIEYLKNDEQARFEESCKYMQFAYTNAKQALFGTSRLDNLTNDYCTDMATYSKKLSRMLSMGCMLTSVAIPAASPVLMPMARMAGYLDNAIDLYNKGSNRQGAIYDNTVKSIISTVSEFFIKQGYRYLSNIAGDSAKEVINFFKDINSPLGNAIRNSAILQTLIQGTSEAIIETGICIPYTMAIQAIQGGEYDFWAELGENFFYDFLPYARGWQDLLIDKPNKFVSMGENEGLYLDELGRPMKFVAIIAGEEFVRARYEYDGDDYKVIETQPDGSEITKDIIRKSDGTVKIEQDGNPYQDTEKLEDGGYKTTYYDEDGNEKCYVITDNEGRILKSIDENMAIEYSESGSVKNITSKTSNGQDLSIEYSTTKGVTTAKVNLGGEEFEYKVNKEGIATITDENGNEISLSEKILLGQLNLGYSLNKGKNDLILISSLSNVTQDDNTTCALAAQLNAIAQKPILMQTLMQNFEYDITTGTWKSSLFGEEIEIELKPGSNFLEEFYKSYKNVYGDDATFDDIGQVFNKLFETGEDICVKPDFSNFEDIDKIKGYVNDETSILTFNTTSYEIEGIEPGHAYTVINVNDLGNMTLVDPQDPEKFIYVTRAQLENSQNYQFEGKTLTQGNGWVDDDSYMRLVAGKPWESANETIKRIRNITQNTISLIDENHKITIGNRELFLTETQKINYLKTLNEVNSKSVNIDYAKQLVMSDVMLPEALATLFKIDISDCANQEDVFNKLADVYIESPEKFAEIGISKDYIDAYFSRDFDESITKGLIERQEMGGDKIVHEICSALESKLESDDKYLNEWSKYCKNSEVYKQYCTLAKVYETELKTNLKENFDMIENTSHLIFRFLQRDSIFDTNMFNNTDLLDMEPISISKIPTFITNLSDTISKINSGEIVIKFDKSNIGFINFMNGQLMVYKDKAGRIKIQTYEYKLSPGQSWDINASYLPQASSW